MERSMKRIISFTVAILTAFITVINAAAQTTESIWLTANTTAYKTGETVIVAFNASSATPIQGFTFQIRYDPSCLKPVNASSAIPGMNGLPLPQLTGLVDGSYASTTPQVVNGILAEVRFTALKSCRTGLYLEDAVLVIRSAEGFAVPLSGVSIGERNVSLIIDKEVGVANSSQPDSGSILPLEPPKADQGTPLWIVGIMFMIFVGLLMLGAYKVFRLGTANDKKTSKPSSGTRRATLHIKHGPHAGKSYILNRLPVLIGRDPQNDICINDPHVISRHAQIYSDRKGYYLRDLGGGTSINGHSVKNNVVALIPGDVVRLGRSVLFVFG
jgi:hypothetical protein